MPRVPQLVVPWSGRRLRVKAVVMSPTEDLAVIETAPLPRWQVRPLVFATTPADAGDTVLEEGYGSTGKAAPHAPGWTSGSVDAIDDAPVNSGPDAGGWTVRDAVLHEATTYPGDSGGPLLNLQGQVVGVNDAGNDEGEVAIPARTVHGEAAALILDILDAAG